LANVPNLGGAFGLATTSELCVAIGNCEADCSAVWAGNSGQHNKAAAANHPRSLACSAFITLEHQRGVGAAEAKAVRHHRIQTLVIDAWAHDRHVSDSRIEVVDMG